MVAKILSFEIPEKLSPYEEPASFYTDISMDNIFPDMRATLGLSTAELIINHRFLVLSWLEHGDWMKPSSEWSDLTTKTVSSQMKDFNEKLKSLVGQTATLLGGEIVEVKRARFVLRDIEHDRQEVARFSGIVSEVLFLELTVYDSENYSWMTVQDYQIMSIRGEDG